MRRRRTALLALLAAALAPQCTSPEAIRVRDRDGLLADARARWTRPLNQRLFVGAEAGGVHTDGDYTSPTGVKDYTFGVGYVAGVFGARIDDATVIVRAGPAWFDFAVEGQMRTLGERGLGAMLGAEARYAFAPAFDVFGRAHWARRSSLTSTWGGVGIGYHPTPCVTFEVGYGVADNRIDSVDLFVASDTADVETQGLSLGVSLDF